MKMNAYFGPQQHQECVFIGNRMMKLGERSDLNEYIWKGPKIHAGEGVGHHDDGIICLVLCVIQKVHVKEFLIYC